MPELTGKRDAIPGRTNELNFTPRAVGTFDKGVCGEFCGIQHTEMRTVVEVVSAEDFEAWLAENEPADPVAVGEQEWTASCAKCHGLAGQGDIGPPIAGNAILTDPAALRELVENGQDQGAVEGYMPPTGLGWTDAQIDALVAYVQSNPELAGPGQ